eukprot:ANDGO_00719.mRNA.1 DNA cross-link repair 1 protein
MNWNGRIPGTPICVDRFAYTEGVSVYLLSHLHADHTAGLCNRWNFGIIYCSLKSKLLLQRKFDISDDYIQTVEIGKDERICVDACGIEFMKLRALDANHAPGALMFYLEGYFGRILLTGDFRAQIPKMIEENPFLRGVDLLVLDDTFLDPVHDFPSQPECLEQIRSLVLKFDPETFFVVGIDSLGKEELLVELAEALQTLVAVDHERFECLKLLGFPDVFTTNVNESRLLVIPRRNVSRANIKKLAVSMGQTVVAIVPSGWMHRSESSILPDIAPAYPQKASPSETHGQIRKSEVWRQLFATGARGACTSGSSSSNAIDTHRLAAIADFDVDDTDDAHIATQCLMVDGGQMYNVFRVPYSIHSSYSELLSFVDSIRPRHVIGLTRSGYSIRHLFPSSNVVENIEEIWAKIRQRLPVTVQDTMASRNADLKEAFLAVRGHRLETLVKMDKEFKRPPKRRHQPVEFSPARSSTAGHSRHEEAETAPLRLAADPNDPPVIVYSDSFEEDARLLDDLRAMGDIDSQMTIVSQESDSDDSPTPKRFKTHSSDSRPASSTMTSLEAVRLPVPQSLVKRMPVEDPSKLRGTQGKPSAFPESLSNDGALEMHHNDITMSSRHVGGSGKEQSKVVFNATVQTEEPSFIQYLKKGLIKKEYCPVM